MTAVSKTSFWYEEKLGIFCNFTSFGDTIMKWLYHFLRLQFSRGL